ncbi:hypothetical protein AO1008_08959 [Aspergillus oryzae 100-8]|uniref:Uncharacterized protein n=1 Tax=Aspergillus oryzae (strain 3.042) TaxID=1160506 RepID=I8TW83_ASPO3|nr:hypothetical protein Ao3042_04990 [Aspergillus oryzae 3.042]KDE82407.1 hypothetical protein AO1008_08959 [Aspergillus oryzae 100-8]|eukprot:EIT78685.1 hypothetical protein Ao3042_04990 [Aspergillus oryzae 3.042]
MLSWAGFPHFTNKPRGVMTGQSEMTPDGASSLSLRGSDNQLSLKSSGHRDTSPETPSGHRANVSEKKQRRRWPLKMWDLVVDQWFLIVMGILIAIASQVQVPKSQQQLKQTVVNYLAVSVIFFINGCTLPTQVLIENLSRWKVHIFTQAQCYLLTSSISYGIVSACATDKDFMDPALLIGIIIVGCLPTAQRKWSLDYRAVDHWESSWSIPDDSFVKALYQYWRLVHRYPAGDRRIHRNISICLQAAGAFGFCPTAGRANYSQRISTSSEESIHRVEIKQIELFCIVNRYLEYIRWRLRVRCIFRRAIG